MAPHLVGVLDFLAGVRVAALHCVESEHRDPHQTGGGHHQKQPHTVQQHRTTIRRSKVNVTDQTDRLNNKKKIRKAKSDSG